MQEKIPHSVRAEQSFLGSLMLNNSAWELIIGKIREEDFYIEKHRIIFNHIAKLANSNNPLDVVTVAELLERTGYLEEAGGFQYVGQLVQDTPTAENIEHYAAIIKDTHVLRKVISAGSRISQCGYETNGISSEETLGEVEQIVLDIRDAAKRVDSVSSIGDIMSSVITRVEELHQNPSPLTGIPTGFDEIDRITSGLQNSDLIIVAARPAMGKTSLAINIAESVAMSTARPVMVFSMEMSREQLGYRMISSIGRLDQGKLRAAKLVGDEWQRLGEAATRLKACKLYIDDRPVISPAEIRATAKRIKRENGDLALIVVDYLQLMSDNVGSENEVTKLTNISRGLKAIAKEMNVPVIALSQLSRKPDDRQNHRPMMSDLRGSGSIEQDADIIMFIYRDEVYSPNSPDKGLAEIILGKHRNGENGTVKLVFLGQYTKFENFYGQVR